jgi:glycosyltransferase involved in cell wall biosynthesis
LFTSAGVGGNVPIGDLPGEPARTRKKIAVRIVYLHQYFNTLGMMGGTRSYEMARRLVARGHEVHMVTTQRERGNGASRRWHQTEEDGIQVHWLPVPYDNRMSYPQRLRAFARFAWASAGQAARLDADVVFATSTPLTIALPGVYAARKSRVPMVLEVRDLWPVVPIAVGALNSRASQAAARWLERFAYRHSARIVALSPDMKTGIEQAGYPPERVTVIPNGCDVDLFDVGSLPGRAVRQQYEWLGERPLVVYTGALGLINGVAYLARLAAAVATLDPEIRFAVIGEGREEELVRRTAHELGVLGRTFFMLPSIPKTEIPGWLSAADMATSVVIDIPELWANCANKVFDAFAAARPIAINHEGWLADLIHETDVGVVLPPHDHQRAGKELVRALRDPEWLGRARGAARRLSRDRFSRESLAARLEQVLVAAARDGGRPGARLVEPTVAAGNGAQTSQEREVSQPAKGELAW